ncbi:uncharacterized protein [Equus przewalskii]|uniref:Uncharacterized protein n=1 Tax=Equus przewalskii TaxID=9798 RepID=A0ABM4M788_EQUPR
MAKIRNYGRGNLGRRRCARSEARTQQQGRRQDRERTHVVQAAGRWGFGEAAEEPVRPRTDPLAQPGPPDKAARAPVRAAPAAPEPPPPGAHLRLRLRGGAEPAGGAAVALAHPRKGRQLSVPERVQGVSLRDVYVLAFFQALLGATHTSQAVWKTRAVSVSASTSRVQCSRPPLTTLQTSTHTWSQQPWEGPPACATSSSSHACGPGHVLPVPAGRSPPPSPHFTAFLLPRPACDHALQPPGGRTTCLVLLMGARPCEVLRPVTRERKWCCQHRRTCKKPVRGCLAPSPMLTHPPGVQAELPLTRETVERPQASAGRFAEDVKPLRLWTCLCHGIGPML